MPTASGEHRFRAQWVGAAGGQPSGLLPDVAPYSSRTSFARPMHDLRDEFGVARGWLGKGLLVDEGSRNLASSIDQSVDDG